MAYAYDDRWPRMSQWDFYKRRLIRLQPMIVMGSLIGAVFFYFQRGPAFPLIAATPLWKMLLVMLVGCTLLPLPTQFDIRGWDEMHPLDRPAWSLFFEYIANILYAFWLRKLSNRWLSLITGLAAILLIHMLVAGEGDQSEAGGLMERSSTSALRASSIHFLRACCSCVQAGASTYAMVFISAACYWSSASRFHALAAPTISG